MKVHIDKKSAAASAHWQSAAHRSGWQAVSLYAPCPATPLRLAPPGTKDGLLLWDAGMPVCMCTTCVWVLRDRRREPSVSLCDPHWSSTPQGRREHSAGVPASL